MQHFKGYLQQVVIITTCLPHLRNFTCSTGEAITENLLSFSFYAASVTLMRKHTCYLRSFFHCLGGKQSMAFDKDLTNSYIL